jgi:hypothetical protein
MNFLPLEIFEDKSSRKISNCILDNSYYLLPKTKKPTGNRLCCIHAVGYRM